MRLWTFGAFALALTLGTAANAAGPNLVTNGDFSLTTLGSLSGFSGSEVDPGLNDAGAVNGWVSGTGAGDNVTYNIWFKGDGSEKGGNTGTDAKSRFGEVGQRPNASYTGACNLAGCGGAFMVLDGDPVAAGPFSQSVSGLVVGQTYAVTFDWAAGELQDRTGFSTEQLHVFLDGSEQSTSVYNNTANPLSNPGSFSGWQQVTLLFTATKTTETLKFLSDGSPSNNLPPVAFLDGVSLTMVPEPATWAMMLVGFGGLGAALRRRRRLAAVAA
jgi:hypothetical protein